MSPLYLSRAALRRDASTNALAALLVPDNARDRPYAEHRLIWSLFADGPDRTRDFLWRSEGPGRFTALSARPPADPHGLFELDFKPFEPDLRQGDRLRFDLRANPVVARRAEPGKRGKVRDVVMDALYATPRGARDDERWACIQSAGRAWLLRQGEANGFTPLGHPAIDGYTRVRLPRQGGKEDAEFRSLDFSGELEVNDPERFLARLAQGYGKARAFGCGLMLIRRAR